MHELLLAFRAPKTPVSHFVLLCGPEQRDKKDLVRSIDELALLVDRRVLAVRTF